MLLPQWLRQLRRRWFAVSVRRRDGRVLAPRRSVPLRLEALEERTVPTTFATVSAGDVATLIADINAANQAGGSNTINLSAGNYDLTAINNYWYGPDGLPAITSNLTINGNGATIERDSSAPDLRLLYVSGGLSGLPAGELTLNNLTLQGGVAQGGNSAGGGGGLGAGGAIFNQGTVALNGVTITDNAAQGGNSTPGSDGGGGIGQDAQGSTGGGFGSGFPTGTYGGVGGSGAAYMAGGGGGFSVDGQDASSGGNGGGQSGLGGLGGGSSGGAGGDGGGGSLVYGNGGAGGDFGFGGIGKSASGAGGGGGGVGGGGGGGFSGGGGSGGGGGFGGGGGEFISGASSGTVSGGLAGFGGGDGSTSSAGAGGDGGFGGGGGGSQGGAGGAGGGMGGAVFNLYGNLTATNSTLTGNTAQGGNGYGAGSGLGGAIFNLDGTVNLTFSTVAANTVTAGTANGGPAGGALYNLAHGHTPDGNAVTASSTLTDSILSNTNGGAPDLVNDQDTRRGFTDDTATVNASAPNLVMAQAAFDGTTITGTPITSDPKLGSLANNGGPTETMALLPGSPAIGAGSSVNAPATDQRGDVRPTTGAIDIGAYEATPPSSPLTLSSTSLPSGSVGVAYNQTISASGGAGIPTISYTLAPGDSIPAGLSFTVNDNQLVIRGTPTASGSVLFTVNASDANETVSHTYTLTVNGPLALAPDSLPASNVGVPYYQTIAASGGTGSSTLTYTLAAGNSIPAGLTFTPGTNQLVLSGTPTAAGAVSFAVTATDAVGATVSQNYTLTVTAAASSSPPASPPSPPSSPPSPSASPPAASPPPPAAATPAFTSTQVQQGQQDVFSLALSALTGDVSLFFQSLGDYHSLPTAAQQQVLQNLTDEILQLAASGQAQDSPDALNVLIGVDLALTFHLL